MSFPFHRLKRELNHSKASKAAFRKSGGQRAAGLYLKLASLVPQIGGAFINSLAVD